MANRFDSTGRFIGYTLEDCACEYCLYHKPRTGCTQEVCCCTEERRKALERELRKPRKRS